MSPVEELTEKIVTKVTPRCRMNDEGTDCEKENDTSEKNSKRMEPQTQVSTSIGIISGEYTCVHNHMQGTLVAGTGGLMFDGRFFFYKHCLVLKWTNLKSILKTEMGAIQVSDHQGIIYEFTSIQHSDRVWATLVTLQNESKLDLPFQSPLQTAVKASFRRTSTVPILLFDDSSNLPKEEAAYMAAATMAQMDDIKGLSERRMAPESNPTESNLSTDLEVAWTELHNSMSSEKSYADVALKEVYLACGLDVFFDLFYSNDAPRSVARFMQENGDKNLSTSQWKQEGIQWKRTIEYSHPINAPLAPPEARARKEQRYRRFGEYGLSIETDTFVDDVPMADCFYVTDRILVEAKENGIRLTGQFDIRFIKTTMFRSIISNTTRREFLRNFAKHYDMMQVAVLEQSVMEVKPTGESLVREVSKRLSLIPVNEARAIEAQIVRRSREGPWWIVLLALTLVLALQVYVIYDVKSMKASLIEHQQFIDRSYHQAAKLRATRSEGNA